MSLLEVHSIFNAYVEGSETGSKYWIQKSSISQIYLTQETFIFLLETVFSGTPLYIMTGDKSYFSSLIDEGSFFLS